MAEDVATSWSGSSVRRTSSYARPTKMPARPGARRPASSGRRGSARDDHVDLGVEGPGDVGDPGRDGAEWEPSGCRPRGSAAPSPRRPWPELRHVAVDRLGLVEELEAVDRPSLDDGRGGDGGAPMKAIGTLDPLDQVGLEDRLLVSASTTLADTGKSGPEVVPGGKLDGPPLISRSSSSRPSSNSWLPGVPMSSRSRRGRDGRLVLKQARLGRAGPDHVAGVDQHGGAGVGPLAVEHVLGEHGRAPAAPRSRCRGRRSCPARRGCRGSRRARAGGRRRSGRPPRAPNRTRPWACCGPGTPMRKASVGATSMALIRPPAAVAGPQARRRRRCRPRPGSAARPPSPAGSRAGRRSPGGDGHARGGRVELVGRPGDHDDVARAGRCWESLPSTSVSSLLSTSRMTLRPGVLWSSSPRRRR